MVPVTVDIYYVTFGTFSFVTAFYLTITHILHDFVDLFIYALYDLFYDFWSIFAVTLATFTFTVVVIPTTLFCSRIVDCGRPTFVVVVT